MGIKLEAPDFVVECWKCSKVIGCIYNAKCFEGNFVCIKCSGLVKKNE